MLATAARNAQSCPWSCRRTGAGRPNRTAAPARQDSLICHQPVKMHATGQGHAIGRIGDRSDPIHMAFEDSLFLPGDHIPQPYRTVLTGTGQGHTIGRVGHRRDPIRMTFQVGLFLSCGHIPQPYTIDQMRDSSRV